LNLRMCPPQDCCCCRLHPGVKAWTIVFIVFSAIGVAATIWGTMALTAVHNLWCTDVDVKSAEHQKFCDDFGSLVILLWVTVILYVIDLIVLSWGCCQISNFNAKGIATFWKIQTGIVATQLLLGIIYASMAPSSPTNYVSPLLGLIFGVWYVYACKVLAERVEKGEITAQNPEGQAEHSAIPQAVQAAPVQAVAVQVVAVDNKTI